MEPGRDWNTEPSSGGDGARATEEDATSARGAAFFSSGGEEGATSANGAAVAAVHVDAADASTAGAGGSVTRGGGASGAGASAFDAASASPFASDDSVASDASEIATSLADAFAAFASALCRLKASSFCFPASFCSSLVFFGGIASTTAAACPPRGAE